MPRRLRHVKTASGVLRSAPALRRAAIVFLALAALGWLVGVFVAFTTPSSGAVVTLLEGSSTLLVVAAVGALLLRPRPAPPRDDRIVAFRKQQAAANAAIRSDLAALAQAAAQDPGATWLPYPAATAPDLVAVLSLTSTIDPARLALVGRADYAAAVDLIGDARTAGRVLVVEAPQEALVAALAMAPDGPPLTCVHHDARALDSARERAQQLELDAIEFIHAPLTGLGAGNWYRTEALEGIDRIDVAYLGGPHWALAAGVRDRTLARLLPLLADGARILVPQAEILLAESWVDRLSGGAELGTVLRRTPGLGTLRLVLGGR